MDSETAFLVKDFIDSTDFYIRLGKIASLYVVKYVDASSSNVLM